MKWIDNKIFQHNDDEIYNNHDKNKDMENYSIQPSRTGEEEILPFL